MTTCTRFLRLALPSLALLALCACGGSDDSAGGIGGAAGSAAGSGGGGAGSGGTSGNGGAGLGGGASGSAGSGASAGAGGGSASPIKPYASNPEYWQLNGKPVLLVGGSVEDNLFQQDNLEQQLDEKAAAGGNYVSNTMSSRDTGNGQPFKKLPSGKYDLDQWDDTYWKRFANFLTWTGQRSIVVQIEVWDRFDYSRDQWKPSPYNPGNNINYTSSESGLAANYPDHPGTNKQPFFKTVPKLQNNQVVLKYQKAVVDKMLSYALTHGHVLYTMDNETSADPAWPTYWATHIQAAATKAGVEVHTTEMWDDWNITAKVHKNTFDHPELYSFGDVSQNTHISDQTHWDRIQSVRKSLASSPMPLNNVKIYGADGGKYGDDADAVERFWRNILGGLASSRFHRPTAGIGISAKAAQHLTAVRLIEQRAKFWDLEPHNDLLGDRQSDEAYLAAKPGQLYVLYFTNGGSVSVDLSDASGKLRLEWVDPSKGAWSGASEVNAGAAVVVKAPSSGPQLAVLDAVQN